MASDRDTLVSEVKFILGQRDDLDTRYPTWVRRAYAHITQSVEFPESSVTAALATVIDKRDYVQPTDFFSNYSFRNNTTQRKLVQISPSEYVKLLTTVTGGAEYYAIFDGNINIHPTPSVIESLSQRYRKIFADLTLGTSVHLLPDVWDQPIVHQAASYAFDAINEIERAGFYRSSVRRFIGEQRSRITGELFDRNESMAPIGGVIT